MHLGLAGCDVEAVPIQRGRARRVGHGHGLVVDPQDSPVLTDHAVLAHERLAAGRRVPVLDQDPVPVVRVQQPLEELRVVEDAVRRDAEDGAAAKAEIVDKYGYPGSRPVGKDEELLEDRPRLDGVAQNRRSVGWRFEWGPGSHLTMHPPRSRL